jgi:signal transduction histidine kinase
VLRRFSETVTGSYPAEQLPARMARVLADGTDAEWAQVWVTVDGIQTLAATWPPRAAADNTPAGVLTAAPATGVRSMPVCHAGELLGLLVVKPRDDVSLTSVEERLFAGLAEQAGLVLRGTALRVQLSQRASELALRADELRASRQRLVESHDEARRLLERDIHDGAQQHLVALAVNLRLAHTLAPLSADEADDLLVEQRRAAGEAIATIDRLAQGIYPPLLTEGGLTAALRSVLDTAGIPVRIDSTGVRRYGGDLEAAAYFCTLEAVQNAVKHSGAPVVRLTLTGERDCLSIRVDDDGAGFDQVGTAEGHGLVNMRDRVESQGGSLTVRSTLGRGTHIRVRLPTMVSGVSGVSGAAPRLAV